MSESVRYREPFLLFFLNLVSLTLPLTLVDGSLLTIKLIRNNSTHFDVKTTYGINSKLTTPELNRIS